MNTLKRNLLFVLFIPLFFGCNSTTNTADVEQSESTSEQVLSMLNETRTTQYFSDESVPVEDITIILDAGKNAASGRNMQPWHFGAIINQEVIKEIAGTMPSYGPPAGAPANDSGASTPPRPVSAFPKAGFADAPAAIALACTENNSFSAGLACENMIVAATTLGYGTKIVMGGAAQLNSDENKALLEIPEDMSVIAILLVGKSDAEMDMTADSVTGASERKPLNEVSTIIQ